MISQKYELTTRQIRKARYNMDLIEKLIDKSKEAFMMAIEVYNKPSIRYRVEGFSFFICNAWELMLKAHMMKKFGENSIYYKDHPDRTISLELCIKKAFTNDKDPLRRNLEKIIELRNTSTHFITEEYEMVYIPLFQACVFNFTEKMQEFHDVDMSEVIPQNFLTLAVSINTLDVSAIRAKYPPEIAERLISASAALSAVIEENNNHFAIRVNHHYYITKDENKATAKVRIAKDADTTAIIVKEMKDPNNTHKYKCKTCCEEINKRLKKAEISMLYKGEPQKFTSYHFDLFCKYYDIKSNPSLCYTYKISTQPQYSYSLQAIDFIFDEIKKDPEHIVQNLKNNLRQKKES